MGSNILGQTSFDSWTFTPNSPLDTGLTEGEWSWTLPAGCNLVMNLLGVAGNLPQTNNPNYPIWSTTQWAGFNLTKHIDLKQPVAGGGSAGIASMKITTATGTQQVRTWFTDCARARGASILLGIRGADADNRQVATDQVYGNGTSIDRGLTVESANNISFFVVGLRGTAGVTPTFPFGTGQVLYSAADPSGQAYTFAAMVTGSKQQGLQLNWAAARNYAYAHFVLRMFTGGAQIFVIG